MSYSIETIKQIAQAEIIPIKHIAENGCKVRQFEIDCTNLRDFNNEDIRFSEEYRNLFAQLAEVTNPTVYVWELISDISSKEIVDSINRYSAEKFAKATPAIKVNYPNSRILYVGKVVRDFYGRVIQHLGFFPHGGTQGLQLFYWAKSLKLTVKLTVFEFEKNTEELMPLFEKRLAQQLQPILGKHKS